MSNIDKQALRNLAVAAKLAPSWYAVGEFGDVVDPAKPEWKPVHEFCKTFTAARVLALLNELEALKLANAAQDDHINQQQDRIDLLEKGNNEAARQINSWRRLAKQNIAEREKDVSELNIARKRIAELEARKVKIKLPASFYPDGDIDCPLVINEYQIIEAIVAADCKPIAVCPRCKCELDLSHKPDGAHFCHAAAAGKGEAS
ncbi:ead/Ea22-like family protein [Enterobacter hormaechei]|uniref:ead/Ea22-like family protein n=1 Tax=Enterobacter hormaechei TaxID=158836 RepID=UPI0007A9006F|nr:ead/Ea22-like family protein [Enterobacter hormaechei]SAJ07917.1 Uncharacterised protein [Enterobacter hormaechei]